MSPLTVADVWDREAWSETGDHLGVIEAVAWGRDRVVRRVGVRRPGGGSGLIFYGVAGARRDGDRVVLAAEPSRPVLVGGGR